MIVRYARLGVGWLVLIGLGVLLYSRRSYQPGPLLAGHVSVASRCAACHQPWRGPQNTNCIACHGNFAARNPHGSLLVRHDGRQGSDVRLLAFEGKLSCLSCHHEHRGSNADFRAAAAVNCDGCHAHASVSGVSAHRGAILMRPASAKALFPQVPFNHFEHKLLIEAQPDAFPKGAACITCHQVTGADPGDDDRTVILWSGCKPCHANPQDPPLGLPQRLGAAPMALPYATLARLRHINAIFNHSTRHLATPCVNCHAKVAASVDPGDADARAVTQCFTCHAHQTAPTRAANAEKRSAMALRPHLVAAAFAEVGAQSGTVVACGDCHWFHRHGATPTLDFVRPALRQAPHGADGGSAAPWVIGMAALVLIVAGGIAWTVSLPAPDDRSHHAVADTAPQRMIKTPILDDTFQTSIKGLYIVGEMAGTASINLAMRSGRQIIETIAAQIKQPSALSDAHTHDVLIVGCGPAGLSATATAKAFGLRYITLERMTPASTLRTYPRTKLVQATPIDISEYGSFYLEGDATREDLVREWEKIIVQGDLKISDRQEVVAILPQEGHFLVRTARQEEFRARFVVLAMGVRGHPRKLGVAGENSSRVRYQLIEPGEFRHQRILVVGGGNAGAEVSVALAEPSLGNRVSYSIRDAVLTKVNYENAARVVAMQRSGHLAFYPNTQVAEIAEGTVVLSSAETTSAAKALRVELENDVVFAMVGAELPTRFLEAIGIRMKVLRR